MERTILPLPLFHGECEAPGKEGALMHRRISPFLWGLEDVQEHLYTYIYVYRCKHIQNVGQRFYLIH